ncbi:MAG: hypothetical protein RL535_303 [Pseudomonadota bacterium]|jgi:hypothetical protein
MKKLNSQPDLKLDADEKALLDAFEVGKMNSSSPSQASLEKFKRIASETISKERLFEKPSNLAKNTG